MRDRQLDLVRREALDGGDTMNKRKRGKEPQNRLRKPSMGHLGQGNKSVKRRTLLIERRPRILWKPREDVFH